MKIFTKALLTASLFISTNLLATDYYWTGVDGGGGFGLWNVATNWSVGSGGAGDGQVPGNGDVAIFDNSNTTDCQIDADVDVDGIWIQGTAGPNGAYTGTINF